MNNQNKIYKSLGAWFSIPWYFIVFSTYPVLALLSFNIGQVKLNAGWRSLFLSALFGGVLFVVVQLFLRNVYRSAFLTTLVLALFFSYGHIYNLLVEKWEKVNFTPYLLTAWLILAILFVIWAT